VYANAGGRSMVAQTRLTSGKDWLYQDDYYPGQSIVVSMILAFVAPVAHCKVRGNIYCSHKAPTK
jgi:hypothetical protein